MGERIVNGFARQGNIDQFYRLIPGNVNLLEEIDELPFVETPLHVAASAGDDPQHIQFAMEMMRLKPSFARKPDLNGFSPIHLALQNGHTRMVRRLLQEDRDLVRVKRKGGRTPLHDVAAAAKGDQLDLMDTFLSYCPNSIEDVTIQNQTALHVALLENDDLGAFERLVKWLRKNKSENGREILNWQDENGNTVLHVAVSKNQIEAVRVLLNCVVNLNVRDFYDRTAQDIWQEGNSSEIKDMLSYDGFLSCFSLPKVTCCESYRGKLVVLSKMCKNTVLFFERLRIFREIILVFERMRIFRDKIVEGSRISNDDRNALLVVAALLMTITYQFVFSPPGGLTQGDQHPGQPSSNTPAPGVDYSNAPAPGVDYSRWTALPGTAIAELTMPHFRFVATMSYITFTLSAIMTFLLLPSGYISALFKVALVQLWVSFYYSWGVIFNLTKWVWRYCLYGTGLCFVAILLAFFGRLFFGVRIKSLNLHLIFYVLYAYVLWRYVTSIRYEVVK